MRTFRDDGLAAPDDFTIQSVIGRDGVGQIVLVVIVCSTGADEDPPLLRRLRGVPGLISDDVAPGYLELQRILDPPFGLRHYWKGHFVRELPDALIDEIWRLARARRARRGSPLIEAIHGAAARVAPDATAVGFSEAPVQRERAGGLGPPGGRRGEIAWARRRRPRSSPTR